MGEQCPELHNCIKRQIADAEFRGIVNTKLENIENTVSGMAKDIKFFYVKVGTISGTVTLIVILLVKVVSN